MMKSSFMLIFTLLGLHLIQHAQAAQPLTIGYQSSLSPISKPSATLQWVKDICIAAKLDCRFLRYPLKRAAKLLKKGSIDALLTIDDQQFRRCCTSSLWTIPAFFGLYAKQEFTQIPRHEQALMGRSLIVIRGSQTSKISFPNLEASIQAGKMAVFEANDRASAIKMFRNNRAEYLWAIGDIEDELVSNAEENNIEFLPFLTRPVAVWFHNSKSHALKQFDQAFEKHLKN